jgi:hypothetical protein
LNLVTGDDSGVADLGGSTRLLDSGRAVEDMIVVKRKKLKANGNGTVTNTGQKKEVGRIGALVV